MVWRVKKGGEKGGGVGGCSGGAYSDEGWGNILRYGFLCSWDGWQR